MMQRLTCTTLLLLLPAASAHAERPRHHSPASSLRQQAAGLKQVTRRVERLEAESDRRPRPSRTGEVEDLSQALRAIRSALAELRGRHDARLAALEAKVVRLEAKAVTLEAKVGELERRLRRVERFQRASERFSRRVEKEIWKLERVGQDTDRLARAFDKLKTVTLPELRNVIASRSFQVARHEKEIARLMADLLPFRNDVVNALDFAQCLS